MLEASLAGLIKEAFEGNHQACAELSDLHFRYQISCGKYSKMLLCFSVIFSTSVGISSFIQKEYWVSVLIGSFSLLSAILQSISKLFKYESLETRHKLLSVYYKNLSNDINYKLLNNSEKDLEKTLEYVKNKMESYLKISPNGTK